MIVGRWAGAGYDVKVSYHRQNSATDRRTNIRTDRRTNELTDQRTNEWKGQSKSDL